MSAIENYLGARAEFEERANKIRTHGDTLVLFTSALEATSQDAYSNLPGHWYSREEWEQLLMDTIAAWEEMKRLWQLNSNARTQRGTHSSRKSR
jgi:hypothetical protein